MILLCGIPSELPLAWVAEALEGLGVPTVVLNQRAVASTAFELEVEGGRAGGWLTTCEGSYPLEDFRGVYLRVMDDGALPELRDTPPDSPARMRSQSLHAALLQWCDVAPARVVNRPAAMLSNSSKPYQLQLVRAAGFDVPATLVTNDPEAVLAFRDTHRRVIYKSMSGVRSIVRTLDDRDAARLDLIRWCPTQFQEYVAGTDVRVHVVGGEHFATEVVSEADDYRYAHRDDLDVELRPATLPASIAERCTALAAALGLPFAGLDLRLARDGRVVCFEVNPSPAYSYYQAHTDQPIATAVARYLACLD